MRRPRLQALQLTSMIDVIFLLLIYFILSSTYTPPESMLAPALQAEKGSSGLNALSPQEVEVTVINSEPIYRVGSRTLRSRAELTALLRALPKQEGVIIRASGSAKALWAARALQAARDAGFSKVTYAPAP